MERTAPWITCILAAMVLLSAGMGWADPPLTPTPADSEVAYPKGYDGFQASRDAQAYWDARRVDAVNRQLGWNELFKWRAATGAPETIYDAPYVPQRWDAWGNGGWPYAIGRIDGYGFYDAVRQPIGRREVQTGPNRWESFPIYAEDVERPVAPLAPPAIEVPAPPPPPKPQGREF